MKKNLLNLGIAAALTIATTGCVDVQEVKDAAIDVIDHAADTATEVGAGNTSASQITADVETNAQPNTNTNNTSNTNTASLSWEQQEEQFWTQPLSEILKDIKASGALENTVSTCGAGTEAPIYYGAPSWTSQTRDQNVSETSREAALLLSCHAEWQSRYVARLFPLVGNDLYAHALWFDSQYYESYQNDTKFFEVSLLSSEANWKSVLQHYLHEEGTRTIRSIAINGLATRETHYYDQNGNRQYGHYSGTWNSPLLPCYLSFDCVPGERL